MDAPTEEERVHAQACHAVALHLEAIRRSSTTIKAFIGIGIVAAVYFKSFWFIGGALVLSIAAHFAIIQSCHRFIARSIGMPWHELDFFCSRYKTDQDFARDVDKLVTGAKRFL